MKYKNLSCHVTLSREAYQGLRDLNPTNTLPATCRLILEASAIFKGSIYELLAKIGEKASRGKI